MYVARADRCFSPGLMILALIRAIQNWRITPSRLYTVLMDHNISYYASVLRELTLARTVFPYSSTIIVFLAVFSVTNIFAWLLLQVRECPKCHL
jgi:hypothetical protein